MSKPKILIFASHYLPGFKAGGPIRSLANLVERFSPEYEFFVASRDRDLGDTAPFKVADVKSWVPMGAARVRYLSRDQRTMAALRRLTRDARPHLLYFNSFFDPSFTIRPLVLRRLGLLPEDIRVIIAPRGEFAQGALALKSFKKKLFLFAARWGGLYRDVVWQASSEFEAKDIRRWFPDAAKIIVAPNVAAAPDPVAGLQSDDPDRKRSRGGRLRVVCVARIARNKNIAGALEILRGVKAGIDFDLYGPNEDQNYWRQCQDIIAGMPDNVRVTYRGQAPHEQVRQALSNYDLFFLPTHGENFGHAILEALAAGLPVLISDRTPWRDLQKKDIGWDLPLAEPSRYVEAIEACASMDPAELQRLSRNAQTFGLEFSRNSDAIHATRALLSGALAP